MIVPSPSLGDLPVYTHISGARRSDAADVDPPTQAFDVQAAPGYYAPVAPGNDAPAT